MPETSRFPWGFRPNASFTSERRGLASGSIRLSIRLSDWSGGSARPRQGRSPAAGRPPYRSRFRAPWRRICAGTTYALMQIPDTYAPWMRRATAAGRKLVKHWRPDIILANAPPNSGLIAAWRIAKVCRAPWIADLRDLWADNSYYNHPNWRLWIDRLMERAVLRSAAGLVTVS